jgi:ABC-type phosphate transport system substrate-binding protein
MKFNKIIAGAIVFATFAISAQAEIAVIVSRDNHNAKMSQDTVARIFLAKTSSFPNDEDAIAIDMKKGSDEHSAFTESFLDKTPNQLATYWSRLIFTGRAKPNKAVSSAKEMKKIISKNPNMIGYIDVADVDGTIRVVAKK